MGTTELAELIDKLPANKKKVVEDLVAVLAVDSSAVRKPRATFGELQGFVTYIADDFDAPLDDFKEYI